MEPPRFLCSQLVSLTRNCADCPANTIVNLEEIWIQGAILESETPLKSGIEIELRCGGAFFTGRLVDVEPHEFGWRAEVEFSPETPWNPEQFRPDHLLDPTKLG